MSRSHPKPARTAPVQQDRARRFLHMGRAVGEMAAGAAAEGMARLARTPGLVPAGLQVAPLLERVRQQLHHETDYRAEARQATAYRALLGDDPVLHVPAVAQAHCTDHILAAEFVAGIAVDRLAQRGPPQAWRDHVALALARLSVRELFDMRLVQTQAVLDMMWLAGQPLRQHGVYDFGASELFGRVFDQGRAQVLGEGYARTPPPDLLFLQRKFVGTFMLCSRLQARLDVGALFGGHL